MNKNATVVMFAMVVIICIRILFDNNDNILYIVAGINVIAFLYIVFTIIDKAKDCIAQRIKTSNVPPAIINRDIKSIKSKLWMYTSIFCTLAIIVYFYLGCSSLGNDIISIISLGMSVNDDSIVQLISNNYKIVR